MSISRSANAYVPLSSIPPCTDTPQDAEKKKQVYQGLWESGQGIVMRAWFCPELDGALRPHDAYHAGLMHIAKVPLLH